MSNISRRGLFGLGAGAAVVPFVKPSDPEAKHAPTVFEATGVWVKREPEHKRVTVVCLGGGGGGGGVES